MNKYTCLFLGSGEQLTYSLIAKKCADNMKMEQESYEAVRQTISHDFIGKSTHYPFNAQTELIFL